MIWLGIYGAGVIVALVLHGAFGSWQDDNLGIFYALVWPIFIPIALLMLPIKLARFVAEGGLASAMSAGTAETRSGSGLQPASAVPKADAQTPFRDGSGNATSGNPLPVKQ